MKTWQGQQRGQVVAPPIQKEIQMEREIPKVQPNFLMFQCVDGNHVADVLHRGTAYCRAHYDDRNIHGKLLDQ